MDWMMWCLLGCLCLLCMSICAIGWCVFLFWWRKERKKESCEVGSTQTMMTAFAKDGGKIDKVLLKQWNNLLEYDGTMKEENDDEEA